MKPSSFKDMLESPEPTIGTWSSIPNSFSFEMIANAGFHYACIDTQHGLIDYASALNMLQAAHGRGPALLVRTQGRDASEIGKYLDAGADGVIVPLVNTRADAMAVASACSYPPDGTRSYGPSRATFALGGSDIELLSSVCTIAQIETAEAVENLEDILSVSGIDALYVGPADLGISLGLGPTFDSEESRFTAALKRILTVATQHEVPVGIHCVNGRTASARLAEGFSMVTAGSDQGYLVSGSRRALRDAQVDPKSTP